MWLMAAVGSALFAGVTSILAKLGIRKTDSDVATAIRTIVVLAFSWLMALVTGQVGAIGTLTAKAWAFLALSGVATGASWICYFKALSMGDVNKVVPIDKTSSVLTILLAIVLFGEVNNLAVKLLGSVAILAGTLLMVQRTGEKSADASAAGHPHNAYLAYAVASAVDRKSVV